MNLKVWPDTIKALKDSSAVVIQKYIKGYLVKHKMMHEL